MISTLSNGRRRLISPSACAGVEMWRAKRRATAAREPLERTRQRQERDAVLSGSLLPFGNAGDQRSLPRKGRRDRLFQRCHWNDWHMQVRTSAGSRGSQATPSALRRKLFFGICTHADSRGGYERVRTNEVLQAPPPLSMHSVQSWVHCGGKRALGMAFIRPRTNLDVRVEVRNDHRLAILRQRLLPTLKADEPVCQRPVQVRHRSQDRLAKCTPGRSLVR